MKLKTITIEGKTYAEVQEGKPLYTHDDGKEIAFDAPATVQKIGQLNGEAKAHREAKEEALLKLKAFEGIEDAGAAKKALATVKNLDEKKLIDAGEVEKVKSEAIKATEEKFKPYVEKSEKLERELHDEKIGGAFSRSKFITEKSAIPADLVQARFGKNFKLKDGKIVAVDQHGNEIFSRTKAGEPAEFEEAIESLFDQYPYKDQILKGSGASGTGARPGSDNKGGAKTISRADFDKLEPVARNAKMKEGFKVAD